MQKIAGLEIFPVH